MKIFGIESGKAAKWLGIALAGSAILCVAALAVSGLPAAIRAGDDWPQAKLRPGKDLSFDASQVFPGAAVKEVSADMSFESAEITASDDGDFHVRYVGAARGIDDWESVFTMEIRDDVLVLESHWNGTSFIGHGADLELAVPRDFGGQINYHSGSGRLNAGGFSAETVTFRLGSGGISIEDISAKTMSIRTGSGSLELSEISAESLTCRTSSGSLRGEGIQAGAMEAKISSGRTVLKDHSGSLVLDSGSGSVDAAFQNPGRNIDIDVSSGGIDLSLPVGSSFDLDASTGSGSIQCDFPVSVSGNLSNRKLVGTAGDGGRSVRLRSSSGSIRLVEAG